jgi:integrase
MAQAEIVRKAKPLLSVDWRDIAERLKPNKPIDARDGALLTVGWAGALRRCELVGLDWVLPADGTGFVTVDERGIVVTLMTSKASQDAAEQIVIPRGDMPADLRALEAWAALAGLQPRQRVFCPIDQQGHLSPKRLMRHSVSTIVQMRMRRLEHRRGKTRKDATAAAGPIQRSLAARRLRDTRGCQGAAELPHSGPHLPQIGGYGAGLRPRKRPAGKEWVEGGRVLIPSPLAIISKGRDSIVAAK